MSQALQAKIQLLAVLLATFTLLSVPMFMQLKDDSAEAVPHARETLLSKMFSKTAKQFNDAKNDPGDVEDFWGQQARANNPQCASGPACDPNGDLDSDGTSNADEIKNGTNPACDEAKNGVDFCEAADRYNVTNRPDPNVPMGRRDLLLNASFAPNGATQRSFDTNVSYPRVEMYVNATGYQGVQWGVRLTNANSGLSCGVDDPDPRLTATNGPVRSCLLDQPGTGRFNVDFDAQSISGAWSVVVWGIVNGR